MELQVVAFVVFFFFSRLNRRRVIKTKPPSIIVGVLLWSDASSYKLQEISSNLFFYFMVIPGFFFPVVGSGRLLKVSMIFVETVDIVECMRMVTVSHVSLFWVVISQCYCICFQDSYSGNHIESSSLLLIKNPKPIIYV